MAFWSGNGGGITVGGGSELNVGQWELTSDIIEAPNTHSGTGGSTNFELGVYDNSCTVEIPWDDAVLPDTDSGLNRGTKVTLVLQMGNSGKTYTLTNTLVKSLRVVNNPAGDIVRATVTTRGGVLTLPTT